MNTQHKARTRSSAPRSSRLVDTGLIDSLGLESLLPTDLRKWQPLVAEAMVYFLNRLPSKRLGAIVEQQLELDPSAEPAARLVALLAQCPTLHKLGQVLARNRALDENLRHQLQTLESMPATASSATLVDTIRATLPHDSGVLMGDKPLAEGSVAVVLPFSWRENEKSHEGVFKVLKPGVETRLAEELAILPGLARMLERRGKQSGLPALDYQGSFSGIQQLLTREVRLDHEQHNMRCASAFLGEDEAVFVPRLLSGCSPNVTAMTRVMGGRLVDALLPALKRDSLADALIEALLAKPFWSRTDQALFHGDLHGGNVLLDEDGRIAIIDWSLTTQLSKLQREALTCMALGGLMLDTQQICEALALLGMPASELIAARTHVDDALDRLACGSRPVGFDWLVEMLDTLALQGTTGFGAELALFRKSWLSLSGVLRDLRGSVSADYPLIGTGLRQFISEWPQRMLAKPDSRDFATHLSNSDLLQLASAGWAGTSRYWSRRLEQALTRHDVPESGLTDRS